MRASRRRCWWSERRSSPQRTTAGSPARRGDRPGSADGAAAPALLRPAPSSPRPGYRDHQRRGVHLHLDGKRFVDRDAFVAHLRTAHHTALARIPDLLLVRDGRVHFAREETAATSQPTGIPLIYLL